MSAQGNLFAEMDDAIPISASATAAHQSPVSDCDWPTLPALLAVPVTETGLDWTEFVAKHGRIPMIQDEQKPWSYRGWLMHYRLLAEECLDIAPRWKYWIATMLAGKILDEPIPKIAFTQDVNDRSPGFKMIDECVRILDNHETNPMYAFLTWLQWGLAVSKTPPRIAENHAEQLYRKFNLQPWLENPHDYIGLWIAEHKGRWNPNAFFPTPHNLCEMMVQMTMVQMTMGEGDHKRKTCNDPAVGTGRFLLHVSNYSLRLSGNDIDGTVLAGCLVNGALYAPWMVRPFPEEWFA